MAEKVVALDETLKALLAVQSSIKYTMATKTFKRATLLDLTIDTNGTSTPTNGYDGFHTVTVNVSTGNYETKNITSNGTYTFGAEYDGIDKAVVNIDKYTEDLNVIMNGVYTPHDSCIGFHKINTGFNYESYITGTISTINLNWTDVPNEAFQYCTMLNTATFPNCESIGDNAFADCYNLVDLHLEDVTSVPTLTNSNAFSSTPIGGYSTITSSTAHIYVPSSLLTSFKAASNWSYFSDRMVGV